ncbi:MAG TPA: 3-hydroxyacyl-CoA dehydrogenase/enoyl-CoA hydratase family protein [Edaphocola sp.]|nr:3-hydroxyacyl-CoA dehydrogenase/enoyl-CoA hydratase family protein [Edaphocola sp.]
MKRMINKVAVLGSGVMGSQIACHFANAGFSVLLLDIVPKDAPANSRVARNAIADNALKAALKMKPSPIYLPEFAGRITTGNFDDNMKDIAGCDWIIEAVIEKLEIKKQVFAQVEQFRKPGSIVTSNTSGIPIQLMAEGRSEDFKRHFCGSHFFNPPRYLRLLEIIPAKETLSEVTGFLLTFGDKFLGKTTVLAKDTPAFIGNRIGVFSIASVLNYVAQTGMTIEEVDALTGPVAGRPKSATFRTADVVGLDTLGLVANGLAQSLPQDECREEFTPPAFLHKMIGNGWTGSKAGQGFYKKIKDDNGGGQILVLDLNTLDYRSRTKVDFPVLAQVKAIPDLPGRFKILLADKGRAGDFYRQTFYALFRYAANRIPEIADDLYRIDDAIEAGFGWQMGPFKIWDALGIAQTVKSMEALDLAPARWVYDMQKSGCHTFYKVDKGQKYYYDIASGGYKVVPGMKDLVVLENLKTGHTVWQNSGASVIDLGDGILNLEFHTKMNTIGGEVLEAVNKAIDLAEAEHRGLVVYNDGDNFSAGANVGLIFMMAAEQDFDELDMAIRQFQETMMRVRYSNVPVVAAPHNMTLGGGCELCLHADAVVAHAETYIGLVEFGVGLIPGGGGTKEFTLRLSDSLEEGDIRQNNFRHRLLTIGQAKVSTSAYEAFDLGYLRKGQDKVIISRKRQLTEAKAECLRLAESGYIRPVPRKDIKVLGKSALGLAYLGADSMRSARYISAHDQKISQKLAYVMCGGDLSAESLVSERYLLDLERQAFLSLCHEQKTLERLQSIVKGGKVLRN